MRLLRLLAAALVAASVSLPVAAGELPPVLQLERADMVVEKGGEWSLWATGEAPAGWPKLEGFVAPTGRAKAELRAGDLQGWLPVQLPLDGRTEAMQTMGAAKLAREQSLRARAGIGEGTLLLDAPGSSRAVGQRATLYLTRTFELADPASVVSLQSELEFAAGAIVYLNGVEVIRQQVLPGAEGGSFSAAVPTMPTFVKATSMERWQRTSLAIPPTMLRAGTNRITVALHRHPDGGHRAFWFDMDLRLHTRAGFIKTPYLQGGDRDWVTVSWETNVAGFGSVRWGLAPDRLDRRVVAPEIAGAHHEMTLTNLPPNSTIYYRAETDPVKGSTARVDAPVRSFRSQPLKGETYRFIAYGDVRTNPDIHAALTRRMWDDALAADARFVVNTGDLTELGSPWDGWQREFFEPALPIMSRLPFFASLGNHEGNHEAYYHYMALPGNEAWYTFERGDAAFFAINSSGDFEEGTEQWRWLDGALGASKAKWKLVFFHHPPFACTPERKPGDLRVQTHLNPLFEKHHVDLALLGHDHLYGRSRDMNGVRYVITGGGGAPAYPGEADAINEVCISAHHYLVVEVAPDHLSWTATAIDGKQLDAFSLTKTPATSSPP